MQNTERLFRHIFRGPIWSLPDKPGDRSGHRMSSLHCCLVPLKSPNLEHLSSPRLVPSRHPDSRHLRCFRPSGPSCRNSSPLSSRRWLCLLSVLGRKVAKWTSRCPRVSRKVQLDHRRIYVRAIARTTSLWSSRKCVCVRVDAWTS
jgi:hypothetical protein